MERKRVAIYCRVDRGGSPEIRQEVLELQKRRLELYAQKRRFQILGYYEDDGFPGHDLKRPGLIQMVKDYQAGMFQQVLVIDRSRLYRGNRWNEPQWPFPIYSLNQLEHSHAR